MVREKNQKGKPPAQRRSVKKTESSTAARPKNEDSLMEEMSLRLAILEQVVGVIAASSGYPAVLDRLLSMNRSLVKADAGTVMVLEPQRNTLVFEVVQGKAAAQLLNYRIGVGDGIAGWVAEYGKSILVPEVKSDPRYSPDVAEKTQYETRNMVCVPILNEQDRVVGVLQLLNQEDADVFNEKDLQTTELFAAMMGNILSPVVNPGLESDTP